MSQSNQTSRASKAFVLVNTELGKEADLQRELKRMEFVKEVYTVYGVYDLIVEIVADSEEKLKETIFENLRQNKCVKTTLTMIVVGP